MAYRQPVSRRQICALRGVNVDGVVRLLEQRGYIEAKGRAEGPGQPVLFGTTDLFLDRLGLATLDAAAPRSRSSCPDPRRRVSSEGRFRAPLAARCETPTDARAARVASACRRCWRVPATGAAAACEDLIEQGRVTVDGEAAELGRRVDPSTARMAVDGVPVPVAPGPRPLPAQQARRRGHHGR